MNEAIRIARSARRHRVGVRHMIAALAHEVARSEGGDAVRVIGIDDRGVELELVLVPDDRRDGWTIIHAMPTAYRRNP
ncbi:hypothetical protein BJ978_000453 [Agromyces terreus]|uniref:Uncharacterized protein n=1 Tax=Agromyces terreus TaxID=424795 RepID=A0A9X2KDP1_9MICO|nr:hypothetical protein [Agromyces terreus]MCP2369777.1 hypothetical protein [Agromyces terreus]